MKKVVSLLLSLAMALGSCVSLNCFAEGPNKPKTKTARNIKINLKNLNTNKKNAKITIKQILFIDLAGFIAGAAIGAAAGAISTIGKNRNQIILRIKENAKLGAVAGITVGAVTGALIYEYK